MQTLVQNGQRSTDKTEQLFLEVMRGPVAHYFDTEEEFDKTTLESNIEASLLSIRSQFKADSVTAKFINGAFADCITMVNSMKGMTHKEQARVLKQYGVRENLQEAVEMIDKYQGDKQQ